MAVKLVTVTNVSKQVIPILVNATTAKKASASATIPPTRAQQLPIPKGTRLTIETHRIDLAQLNQLRRKRLLTFIDQ